MFFFMSATVFFHEHGLMGFLTSVVGKAAFETVPEEHATTPATNRPNSLGMVPPDTMMNYRVPAAGTIRETRGSDSS
ncbi:hypothetical protein COOONC_24846 [Cooperia oncophora]